MASRSISSSVALLAALVAANPDVTAEEGLRKASKPADLAAPSAPGIHVDRLSQKQLRAWKAIEATVFATDASGRLKHAKLCSLWQWVEKSGNLVHVELSDPMRNGDREAGKFLIEKSGFDGQKHIAVIRLCLRAIDEALVRKRVRGSGGFIRFEGLRKKERYAEVLGHELAHAVWALGDQDHARLLEELNAEVEKFERSRRRALNGAVLDEQERQSLYRIEFLMTQIETPAKAAEAEVWKELLESRGK